MWKNGVDSKNAFTLTHDILAIEVRIKTLLLNVIKKHNNMPCEDTEVVTYSFSQLSIHHEVVHMFFCFGKF